MTTASETSLGLGVPEKRILKLTQLLFSCWIVSSPDEKWPDSIPASHHVLDHALKEAVEAGAFPEWARSRFTFVKSQTGLRCLELEEIFLAATDAKVTSDPNPTYKRTFIEVSKAWARRYLNRLQVDEESAVKWGQILRDRAVQYEDQLAAVQTRHSSLSPAS